MDDGVKDVYDGLLAGLDTQNSSEEGGTTSLLVVSQAGILKCEWLTMGIAACKQQQKEVDGLRTPSDQ